MTQKYEKCKCTYELDESNFRKETKKELSSSGFLDQIQLWKVSFKKKALVNFYVLYYCSLNSLFCKKHNLQKNKLFDI